MEQKYSSLSCSSWAEVVYYLELLASEEALPLGLQASIFYHAFMWSFSMYVHEVRTQTEKTSPFYMTTKNLISATFITS